LEGVLGTTYLLFIFTERKMSVQGLSPSSTFGKKGQILHCQAREIVANVIDFMKMEAEQYKLRNEPTIPLQNFRERILAATGISKKMYSTITRESKAVASGTSTSFSTPRKKRQRTKKYELVEGEKHAIRTIVHEFHVTEKKVDDILFSQKGCQPVKQESNTDDSN
jgi:hypothetical protein